MADSKPINWAYPFETAETSADPLQYLTHMAKAKDGYYPSGESGLWHGGVHFDKGTAAVFDQSSVRCIADGEVIAYRVNETYPISEYTEAIPQIKRVPFSSGFVLVKHRLQPPQPSNGTSTVSEQTPPTLTLYSLYMHLQDWASYKAKADLPRPGFWEAASYIVDTKDQGLNVRAEPNTNGTHLAVLAKGTQITASHIEGDYCKLLSIASGAAEPALTLDSEGKLPGFVAFNLLKAQHEPKAKDSVVVLDPGIAIKAGDLIGHLGTYQNHNGAAQPLLHLEVFSCEDVPSFISKSQAWARSLPDTEKTLLKVHKDASRLITHRDDIKADNPPQLGDAGSQIGVDLIIPQALLDGLPAANKIKVSTAVAGSNIPQTTHWWRLDGLFADRDGNPINGWLAEQDLITTRHSPWEWPDFQCIEDTGKPVEKLAYTFNARGMLSDEEKQNYRAQISKADGGPIIAIARLYDIVDTDKDGVLTNKEIRTALGKPWHARVLGQLITKYESEWFWNKSKWDELDPLLAEEPGRPNQTWEIEKQRIEKLSWWKELVGKHGISGDGKAWHFQPVSTLTLFMQADQLINVDRFIEKYVSSHSTFNVGAAPFSQSSKSNLRAVIEHINKYYDGKHQQANLYELAYMFATARHEAWHFLSSEYFSAKPEIGNLAYFNKYDPVLAATQEHRTRAINNENTMEGDGFKYRGRGLVHLTWKANYRKAKENLGINFVEQPDRAAEYEHAVPIMIWGMKTGVFTGHKLASHINASGVDYVHARKIINGSDQQSLIASYAEKFEAILRETSNAKETFNP